jgi:hypothetical protein
MASIIEDMLREERERNLEMQRAFQDEIAQLPRGSLVVQNIRGNDYCYLKYREHDKVVSRYAGKAEDCKEDLEQKIARRRRLEESLRRISAELKMIRKAIGAA